MASPYQIPDKKGYHCALDDTIDLLEEITANADTLTSIFETDVLVQLKHWNETYGAKFSLYLFYEKLDFNLSKMTDKFRDEWIENSDWLRLSFHSRTKKPGVVDFYLYFDSDYDKAYRDFVDIKREIIRFAGEETWDNFPRSHFWSGTRESVRAWKDCGAQGMFFSYPGFPALYFEEEQLKSLWQKDFWYDDEMEFLFITTNVKLPCLTVAEVEENLATLEDRNIIEIFADDYNIIELKEHMETAIKWAVERGYEPVFYDELFPAPNQALEAAAIR